MEPWDDRGQSIQIGAVLVFAALILLLSLYQATIVPQQNEQVEFDHSQQVQGDLLDLRNAVTSMFGESASRSVSIRLGTTYPSRVLAVNPPPVSGLLRTDGTADGDVSFALSNVEALDEETDDFWDTGGSPREYRTGAMVYRPSYNEYGQPPRTVYDSTVLYDNFTFEGATIARSDQTLVDGSTVSLVALNGSLQRSSSGATSVDVRPVSASSTTVAVTNRAPSDPLTVRTATRLPESTWEELLADEANVTDVRTSSLPVDGFRTLEVDLRPGTYELRMAKAGVGTRVTGTDPAYMTDLAADGSTVPEGGSVRLTVEVRDAFNNPIAGVNVTGNSTDPAVGTLASNEVTTGDDGRATFRFDAKSVTAETDVPVEFNFTLDSSPSAFDPRDPEDIEAVVEVQNTQVPGGSGGGGAGYSLTWTDATSLPGTTSGGEPCTSAPDPCEVAMQSETSTSQIGAPVGFGSNDTGVARVLQRSTATDSDGTAETTVRFERAVGNATLWTQSAGTNDTRLVSTPSYESFESGFGKYGVFGSFQGSGPELTSAQGSNSGSSAIVLHGGDDGGIVTTGYDTTGAEMVVVQYWAKESDEGDLNDGNGALYVEYLDGAGTWQTADTLPLTGTNPGQQRIVRLGADAIHGNFSLRFRQQGADDANDEWLIDDPQISVIGKAVGGGEAGGRAPENGGGGPGDGPADTTPPTISEAEATHDDNSFLPFGDFDDEVLFTVDSEDASGVESITLTVQRSTNGNQLAQRTVQSPPGGDLDGEALDLGTEVSFNGNNGLDITIEVVDTVGNSRTCTGKIDSEDGTVSLADGSLSCSQTSVASVPLVAPPGGGAGGALPPSVAVFGVLVALAAAAVMGSQFPLPVVRHPSIR
ncbi:Ig-like domain-containing protein [Halosimplex rubrum]|uniref:Ig-like domain-containing protein n=1 Tax=Halosimplex rubrum TaxID=869889 RepID=A0A7D5P7T5_9EURY|nr:Ig-like domain-containing protein [Halosimplex rubrum]QLH79522.1 Ig-like domain-containing protein [Halosimplex rubrum]